MARAVLNKTLRSKLARVRILLCDVDGILTDTGIWMGNDGETKRFCVQDGLGLRLLREAGLKVGWISARISAATEQRARELQIDFLHQSRGCKVAAAEPMLAQSGLGWAEVCYMGDDIVDLGMLKRAGVAVAVPHGHREAKRLADYVTRAQGGHGAVREVVEHILQAQDKWQPLLAQYSA
jgi:3-deoxy-D-manno-octulosonate 8-phosphate phosphatase (KDO 8-P phosphatase)